jgi:hypothetical protein
LSAISSKTVSDKSNLEFSDTLYPLNSIVGY